MNRELYEEHLKSEKWRWLCDRVREHYGHRCALCNRDYGRMDCHHRTYVRLGDERFTDIILLCETCHAKHHNRLPVLELQHAASDPKPNTEYLDENGEVLTLKEIMRRRDSKKKISF
jgi:5-methylcytosine-specific restriction endonuclease McrA